MRNFRNVLRLLLALGFLLGSWAGISVAQQVETKKLAQTGMKFLQVATNARQTAMGDAFTAADGYSASMFYNPAGMAKLGSLMDVSIGQTQWIADINHKAVSFAIKLEDIGTFGLAAQYVDYG